MEILYFGIFLFVIFLLFIYIGDYANKEHVSLGLDFADKLLFYLVIPLVIAFIVCILNIEVIIEPIKKKYGTVKYEEGYKEALIEVYSENSDGVKWDVEMEIKVDTVYNFKRKIK